MIGFVAEERTAGDVRLGPFRPLVELTSGGVRPTPGAYIHDGMEVWPVPSRKGPAFRLRGVAGFFDRIGPDHCVYFASFAGKEPEELTLVATAADVPQLREPSSDDTAYFRARNTTCVVQGDYDPGTEPPCTPPRLLAVSDLDGDGLREFWATEPYMWDTGLSLWKEAPEGLESWHSLCVGCSD